MSYLKHKKVVFKDLLYYRDEIGYSIDIDGSRYDYRTKIPGSWSTDYPALLALFNVVPLTYALGYCAIAEEVVIDFPVDTVEVDFINRIRMPFFSGLAGTSGQFLLAKPCLGELKYTTIKEMAPFARTVIIPEHKKKVNAVAMGYSGGKESTLCYQLYDRLNYEIHPLYVLKNIDLVPEFDEIKNLEFILETAHPWNPVMEQIGFDHWYPSLSLIRLLYTTIHGVINGCFHIINGNEFNRTELAYGPSGAMNFGTNFGQSNFGMKFVQHFLYYKGIGHNLYSPVQNMSELLEEVILWKHFPVVAEKQVSCFTELQDETGRVVPCNSCPKCIRMSALITAIQKMHANFMLPADVGEKLRFGYPTKVRFGSTNAEIEEQALQDMLSGKWTDAVEKVMHLRFDDLHPASNIPDDVLALIQELITW